MKILTAIAISILVTVSAWPATVVFNLTDFITGTPTLQRKVLMVEPLTAVHGNTTNLVITGERRSWNTGTNAQVVATNMVAGTYRCSVFGGTWTSVFRIKVIATNGTIYASDVITSANASAIDTEAGTPLELE